MNLAWIKTNQAEITRLHMAINKIEDNNEKLVVELNNGDLRVLKDIVEKWDLKDKESGLRFGLAILNMSKLGTLFIEKDGRIQAYQPGDDILRAQA